MGKTALRLTPADAGRPMTLDEFEEAAFEPGYRYELIRGVLHVSPFNDPSHQFILEELVCQMADYVRRCPKVIKHRCTEAALYTAGRTQHRRADYAIFCDTPSPFPGWRVAVPTIVVEVISGQAEEEPERDYVEKRQEYLEIGVNEYWIIDRSKQMMLALCRSGNEWEGVWVPADRTYTTDLLPDFELDLPKVLAAADK